MARTTWTQEDNDLCWEMYDLGMSYSDIAKHFDVTYNSIKSKIHALNQDQRARAVLSPSQYPVYNEPLVYEGDCLVLPDPEFPFQHSAFINRCVALAKAWDIKHLVIPGDMLHVNSLSAWEPPWGSGSLAGPNLSLELKYAREQINALADEFDTVDLALGNHEGRIIRTLGSVLDPNDLLRWLSVDMGKWRTAPYYFQYVISRGEKYLIEHPKNSAKYSAEKLADKYQCHIVMAHSHRVSMLTSKSGDYQAWQIGACVDERRLPYASQRHNTGDPHNLGAAIIRDGYLWVLTDKWTDWDALEALR